MQRTDRVLKRAEDLGLLFSFLALLLVETGYVAGALADLPCAGAASPLYRFASVLRTAKG